MLCLLSQEEVVDDVLPDLVVQIEIRADDDAGHEDDDRALDQLLLARPLDLLQLAVGLADEVRRSEALRLARRLALRAAADRRRTPRGCRRRTACQGRLRSVRAAAAALVSVGL